MMGFFFFSETIIGSMAAILRMWKEITVNKEAALGEVAATCWIKAPVSQRCFCPWLRSRRKAQGNELPGESQRLSKQAWHRLQNQTWPHPAWKQLSAQARSIWVDFYTQYQAHF